MQTTRSQLQQGAHAQAQSSVWLVKIPQFYSGMERLTLYSMTEIQKEREREGESVFLWQQEKILPSLCRTPVVLKAESLKSAALPVNLVSNRTAAAVSVWNWSCESTYFHVGGLRLQLGQVVGVVLQLLSQVRVLHLQHLHLPQQLVVRRCRHVGRCTFDLQTDATNAPLVNISYW